jgi:hypothetical protein
VGATASLWQSTQLVLGVMRAALVGMTSLATLLAQGSQVHRRLADRRRKRPRQVLHTPRGASPPHGAGLNQIATAQPPRGNPPAPHRHASHTEKMTLS